MVDLPAPFSPSNACTAPRPIEKEAPSTATVAPYALRTCSTDMAAAASMLGPCLVSDIWEALKAGAQRTGGSRRPGGRAPVTITAQADRREPPEARSLGFQVNRSRRTIQGLAP